MKDEIFICQVGGPAAAGGREGARPQPCARAEQGPRPEQNRFCCCAEPGTARPVLQQHRQLLAAFGTAGEGLQPHGVRAQLKQLQSSSSQIREAFP